MSSITSIHRAIAVIDALAAAPQGLRFNQLRSILGGISPTTVSRILRILVETQAVAQRSDKVYVLGQKIHTWGAALKPELDLQGMCMSEMKRLASTLECSSILWKRDGDDMVTLHKEVHPYAPSLMCVGCLHPIGFHLIGGIFFQQKQWNQPDALLATVPQIMHHRVDLDLIKRMIDTARSLGYMDDEAAFYPGNYRLAIPIVHKGTPIAALGLAINEGLMDEDFKGRAIRELLASKSTLNRIITHF